MIILPLDVPSAPTDRQFETVMLLEDEHTWPMVLVPIATGFVGWSAVLLAASWVGGGRRWARLLDIVCPIPSLKSEDQADLNQTNMGFHWACTIVTWIAFGLCIQVTDIARNRIRGYNNNEDAGLATPLEVRYGNAVWLTLVSAVSHLSVLTRPVMEGTN